MKLRAYVMRNLDGRNSAMVAAGCQADAASKLGTTTHQMRQMGWGFADGEDAAVALKEPGTVFYRPIDNSRGYPWSTARYERDYPGVATYKPRSIPVQ